MTMCSRPFWCSLNHLPQRGLMAVVHGYRFLLKPWLGNACRFEPSCSAYALQALQRHGAIRGSALTGWRVLRCQPWCQGGCDAVPETFPNPAAGLFTRLGLRQTSPAAENMLETRNQP